MKKLISTTLAVTMLTVPLISSACFADKAKESNILCAQHKNHSESLKEKKFDSKKTGKILAGITAGTAALTGVTAAALKLAEDKLPENIKSKLPFLYTKKSQESQENIEKEKISEPETTKNENFETIVTTKSETKKTEPIDSTIRKPETVKNITTKHAATNNLAVTNNTKTAITQPTKMNTTSNNIKPATKNKVNASTVTTNIITNHTIYTNATNGSSNLNKTSENLLSSDTPWKTALISAAAISALTAAVTLAFLHPNLRNSFSQNFEKLKKECNKLGVTLGSSLKSLFSGTGKTQTTPGSKWTLVEVIDPTVIKDLDAAIKMAQNTIGHLNRIEEYAFNQPLTTSQQLADQLVAADLRVAAIDQVLQLFEYPNEQARSAAKLLFRKLGIEASRDAAQRTRIAIYEEVRKILLYEAELKDVSEGMKRTAVLMAETCNFRLERL